MLHEMADIEDILQQSNIVMENGPFSSMSCILIYFWKILVGGLEHFFSIYWEQ